MPINTNGAPSQEKNIKGVSSNELKQNTEKPLAVDDVMLTMVVV